MDGNQPTVVAQNPYAVSPGSDDPQALADQSTAHVEGEGNAAAAPAAPAKAPDPNQLASVEVLFPHDHG